jgi:hypothetical protein
MGGAPELIETILFPLGVGALQRASALTALSLGAHYPPENAQRKVRPSKSYFNWEKGG